MSKRVMVVDDSRFIFEEMKLILSSNDFQIVSYCRDAEQALKDYGVFLPDVVTMDIILPGMDGLDATRALVKQWPDAKVIIVSSLAYDETLESAKDAGALDFVFKPFDPDQIVGVLNRVLAEDSSPATV